MYSSPYSPDPPAGYTYGFGSGPERRSWNDYDPEYSPGTVVMKQSAEAPLPCAVSGTQLPPFYYERTLTTLVFTSNDGTEHVLTSVARPNQIAGQCIAGVFGIYVNGSLTGNWNRGKDFVATDGSGITFRADVDVIDEYRVSELRSDIANAVSGKLVFPNGTQYEVSDGYVRKIRDRNGNLTTYRIRLSHA